MTAFITACLAILMGVVPLGGIIEEFERFRHGIDNFRTAISDLQPRPDRLPVSVKGKRLKGQIWFAVGGIALMVLTVVEYLFQ